MDYFQLLEAGNYRHIPEYDNFLTAGGEKKKAGNRSSLAHTVHKLKTQLPGHLCGSVG